MHLDRQWLLFVSRRDRAGLGLGGSCFQFFGGFFEEMVGSFQESSAGWPKGMQFGFYRVLVLGKFLREIVHLRGDQIAEASEDQEGGAYNHQYCRNARELVPDKKTQKGCQQKTEQHGQRQWNKDIPGHVENRCYDHQRYQCLARIPMLACLAC